MYVHIFEFTHMCTHTPLRHMCYPGPQSDIEGQTSPEEGWPTHLEDALTRPSASREVHESKRPLVELAGHSIPRLSLPEMTQESPVYSHGCSAGGAQGEVSTQMNPKKAKPEPRALREDTVARNPGAFIPQRLKRDWGWG